jgi:hypothetical protein
MSKTSLTYSYVKLIQLLLIIRVHQGTSRQGANSENFKNSGEGGKLIGFNRQFLAKSP